MPLRPTDSDTFGAMLSAVAAVYGREITPEVSAIYWAALAPYDLAAVRQAFDRHVRNPDAGQFLPKPADLIRMLGGTTADSAMQAWAKVERAIRRVGGHDRWCSMTRLSTAASMTWADGSSCATRWRLTYRFVPETSRPSTVALRCAVSDRSTRRALSVALRPAIGF